MDIAGTETFLLSGEEVVTVGVKERILAIRLLDKVNANPTAARKLGIAVENAFPNVRKEIDKNQAEKVWIEVKEER